MTVTTTAPAGRAIIDLGGDATVLDAAARIAAVEPGHVIVMVVPAGAPVVRNAVFFDVLRRRAGQRRLVVVSSDARARSLAASVHLRTFTSLATLERHELDATERLGQARRTALASIAAQDTRRTTSVRRSLAVFACLVAAAAILFAVVAPQATVTVAASTSPIGPYEYDLRAGPGGDIQAVTLGPATISRKLNVPATGSRLEDIKATGAVVFSNLTTNETRIPKGTPLQTSDGIKFQTTEDKTLPASKVVPLTISTVTANIEAVSPGPRGNVAAGRITQTGTIFYSATNPAPTTGGDTKTIPIVTTSDYDKAVAPAGAADKALADETEAQVAKWKSQETPKQRAVYAGAAKRTGVTPASEVLGKELPSFDLTVTGTLTGYSVASSEPRQTALQRLSDEAPDNDIDTSASAKVDTVIGANVADDGVHWRVRATSVQSARPDRGRLSAALAGRSLDEAAPIITGRGFHIVQVSAWPSWWPRLPVLDSRITIEVAPPVSASGP
jgi:hypothetical protein